MPTERTLDLPNDRLQHVSQDRRDLPDRHRVVASRPPRRSARPRGLCQDCDPAREQLVQNANASRAPLGLQTQLHNSREQVAPEAQRKHARLLKKIVAD
jgi:hypothetical protein